jgi:hypothetical protein
VALILSASRTKTFNLTNSFSLSNIGRLISKLLPTSDAILSFFFFSSIDNDFLSIFNSESTFDFSVDPSEFAFGYLIDHLIVAFFSSIEKRILILVLSTSRSEIVNSRDSLGLLTDSFLKSKLRTTSNEIISCFFSSLLKISCLFSVQIIFRFFSIDPSIIILCLDAYASYSWNDVFLGRCDLIDSSILLRSK